MSSRQLRRMTTQESHDFDQVSSDSDRPVHRSNMYALLSDEEPPDMSDSASSVSEESIEATVKKADGNSKTAEAAVDDWDSLDFVAGLDDREPLLAKRPWNTVDLDGLDEAKDIRERTGTVSGQLKRPLGRIIAPRKNWPKIPAAALGFKIVPEDGVFRVSAGEEYIEKFHELQLIISSADVAAMSMFNKEHPEMVEGYLLMSDVMRQHSVADAANLTELSVYLLEKALPIGFSWAAASFSYDQHPDSRTLFLAIFRHIQFLARRASWATALETAKILFNIDQSDPLLVMLLIDYILLQTGDIASHDELCAQLGADPRYPFLVYSNSLLHHQTDRLDLEEAEQVLHKADISTETYTHSVFKLYFARCSNPHWKSAKIPKAQKRNDTSETAFDCLLPVYRHGLLSDLPNIHLAYPSSSTTSLDPFPPTSDGIEYGNSGLFGSLSNIMRRLLL